MKNKKIIYILICLIIAVMAAFIFRTVTKQPVYDIEYIAMLNGEKIPLAEYKIYLREQIITFENIAGTDIWKTTLDGISTQEIAKQNALNSIVFVKLSNDYASNNGITLTQEDKDNALYMANSLYSSFSAEETQLTDINVIINIMEENIIQEHVFNALTQNYSNHEEKIEIFSQIYDLWLEEATIEINTEVWDSIVIG